MPAVSLIRPRPAIFVTAMTRCARAPALARTQSRSAETGDHAQRPWREHAVARSHPARLKENEVFRPKSSVPRCSGRLQVQAARTKRNGGNCSEGRARRYVGAFNNNACGPASRGRLSLQRRRAYCKPIGVCCIRRSECMSAFADLATRSAVHSTVLVPRQSAHRGQRRGSKQARCGHEGGGFFLARSLSRYLSSAKTFSMACVRTSSGCVVCPSSRRRWRTPRTEQPLARRVRHHRPPVTRTHRGGG